MLNTCIALVLNSSLCIIEGYRLAEANAQDPHPSFLPVKQALPNLLSIFLISAHEAMHVQLLTHCLAFRKGVTVSAQWINRWIKLFLEDVCLTKVYTYLANVPSLFMKKLSLNNPFDKCANARSWFLILLHPPRPWTSRRGGGAMMWRAQKAEKLFPDTPLDSAGVREVWFSSYWTPACVASSTADCGLLPDSRSGVSSEIWQSETSEQ